jgi:hypothetical protein
VVDVFSEVDEDLRREKLKQLAKKFGPYVIGGIVLFIGAMGGRVYWNDYVKAQRIAESEQYQQAMNQLAAGNSDAAVAGFEALIGEAKYGYDLLARLQVASRFAAEGRAEEALAAYDAIAADGNLKGRFRDFASLMAAAILLDQNAGGEVYDRLLPLAEEGGAWQYSAREMLGLAYFREGNWRQAEDTFVALTIDNRVPPDLRNRAQEFMEMIENAKPVEDLFDVERGNDPLADGEENVADREEPDSE